MALYVGLVFVPRSGVPSFPLYLHLPAENREHQMKAEGELDGK